MKSNLFSQKLKEVLESSKSSFFDKKLSGTHIYDKNKTSDEKRLYEGKIIDIKGKSLKKFPFKYLGIVFDKYYFAQNEYEGDKWGMFDYKTGKEIWTKNQTIHHEITTTKKNTLLVLDKKNQDYRRREVGFDIIIEYDFKGNEIWRWDSWKNLKEIKKNHRSLTLDIPKVFFIPEFSKRGKKSPWGSYYDYYHFNSVQEIPENSLEKKDKRFRAGNLLVSARHGSLLFIIDKKTSKIEWCINQFSLKDELQGQHAAQITKEGKILLFDNGRYRGWSRIIEFNPISLEIEFEYKDANFFSKSQGYVQKLKNGNYLITESEKGRVFEITKSKNIVWEFYHPEIQNKKNSTHQESFGKRQWIYRMNKLSL